MIAFLAGALARRIAALLPLLGSMLVMSPAHGFDESELLPVDEAFVLEASTPTHDTAQFTFTIAPGYYLYRHRMSVEAMDRRLTADALVLPPGQARHDEFFGDVETYRDQVTATLPGLSAPSPGPWRFKVKFQGCADAGICYPPQVREVSLILPPASPRPAMALPARPSLPGLSLGGLPGNVSPSTATGSEALPLPAEEAFGFEAIATSPVSLLLRFTPAPGYYLYRDRTELSLTDAIGTHLATPQWPPAQPHQDEHFGDVAVYFDQVEVPLGLRRSHGDAGTLTLEARFQGCQTDGICYPPMTRQVRIDLPQARPDELVSEVPVLRPDEASRANRPHWLLALAFALGGGLILNLMPCVLPVLSLKALSLAQSGESREKARHHALWYTAGVLVSFGMLGIAVLALRQFGLAIGWGFQLQQPVIVAALAYLMAAVGLSLSGVFTMGASWSGAGQRLASRSGPSGDFFTGVLAVVVASPCVGPLIGSALAFAFTAPPILALLVFLTLGLGLALPFLVIGFVPASARWLPRPGHWMETLKQVLAFPMYLTAVWLLWVLGQQRGVDAAAHALAGIVVLALALWCWEKTRWKQSYAGRMLALLLAAIALWPLLKLPSQPASAGVAAVQEDGIVPYSAERLEALRKEGRTVFVNMTADWCVTCKANEKRLLDTETFRQTLARHDALYMKGDWTSVDPAITAFLEAHGAVGVPLYVAIVPGKPDTVLPTVLTAAAVESALAHP